MDEMNEVGGEKPAGPGRQGAFSRILNSIRTQYSIATAFFLLVVLAVFYIGSRIVLVHLIRDAERQVREVGLDISRMAYRNADVVKSANSLRVEPLGREMASGRTAAEALASAAADGVSLLAGYSPEGSFVSAAQRVVGEVVTLSEGDFSTYADRISLWMEHLGDGDGAPSAVGIVKIGDASHYVMLAQCAGGGFVLVGSPFVLSSFAAQVNEGFGGYSVRISDASPAMLSASVRSAGDDYVPAERRDGFGLAPMISEALNFYSGGFWDIGGRPFEAVFAIHDIAGRPVTSLSVSLPKTFASVTRSALGRLTFFIAMAGIVLILPIFWFQGRVLLNPLSRMTEDIRSLARNHRDADCPRLEWKGKDEFALLAESVNTMLETISVRTVQLGQLERSQRALIEGVPDALSVFDAKGRVVSITKQPEGVPPLPGFKANELPLEDVYGPAVAENFLPALERVFSGRSRAEKVQLADLRGPEKDRRSFEMRLTRMDDHFALAVVRDVTREVAEHAMRVAAEKRNMDMSKRESLTLFAAGIAHDVNNILSVILNTAESRWAGAGGKGAGLDAVRDAVKRGAAMMQELRAFAGETEISLVRVPAEFVLRDVQTLAESVVGENIAISFSSSGDAPDVDVDPHRLWKVFFNIVKNSGEAIGARPGHIALAAERFEMTRAEAPTFMSEHGLQPGVGAIFRVVDDGPGIKAELLPRLFDPYVSSKSLGRGLGLATARTVVEAHGGGIRVRSEVDRGTVFEIYLPESRLAAKTQAAPGGEGGGGLPSDVLVVDNDEAILRTTSILLKSIGVAPHVARDRHESLAILRRLPTRIGTVLLDANLGGIDTVRLLEAFRIAAPKARIVVSSGSREEDLRKMFAAHPFDAFLAKPYTLAELKDCLSSGS